ncbi:MAG: hypothetical protein R3Y13_02060 [bacterium]
MEDDKKTKKLKLVIGVLIVAIIIILISGFFLLKDNDEVLSENVTSGEGAASDKEQEEDKEEVIEPIGVTLGKLSGVTYKEVQKDEEIVFEVDTIEINSDTEYAVNLNEYYANLSKEAIDSTVLLTEEYLSMWSDDYYTEENLRQKRTFEIEYSANDSVGSISATAFVQHVEAGSRTTYYFDNINIKTGEAITNGEVLESFSLSEEDALTMIGTSCNEYFSPYNDFPYDCDIASIDDLTLFIKDGELYYYYTVNDYENGYVIEKVQ